MRKQYGFTLIELLAVIIILGLIGSIIIPTVTKTIKNSKEKLYNSQIKMIEQNSKKWAIDNINVLSEIETIYLDLQELINSGYIEQQELKDPRDIKKTMNGCILIKYNNSYNKYEYEYVEDDCDNLDPLYADTTGAATPELTTGMIPVKWDSTNWVKADIYQEWYDYATQEWANAVTVTSTNRTTYLNAAAGTVIPMSDINTMWVWIPRYKYAIPTGTGAREINIVFESKTTIKSTGNATGTNYRTHPAFTFGTTEISGIWIGKFETTGSIGSPTILPNTTSLRGQTVKAMYDSSRAMQNNPTYGTNTDGNIHMAKDSEWGAVAYLSRSIYGKNNEIFVNPSASYVTGRGGSTVSQTGTTDASGSASSTLYGYDGKQCSTKTGYVCTGASHATYGTASSTTGNIYGIYDMSGGSWEFVMGMYRPTDATSITDNSGFGATTTNGTLPTSEYWNRYIDYDPATACSSGICYGSALSETSSWYSDDADFVDPPYPWSVRGGSNEYPVSAGVFSFFSDDGSTSGSSSFRIAQIRP